MERDLSHYPNSILLMDTEAIEQLRLQWKDYILGLEKTPTELQLSKARAYRALELVSSNRNRRFEKASSSSKCVRPLTALYRSPRITCRMKKILDRQALGPAPHDESHSSLCPQCGLTQEKHAEHMLYRPLAQHRNLLRNAQRL